MEGATPPQELFRGAPISRCGEGRIARAEMLEGGRTFRVGAFENALGAGEAAAIALLLDVSRANQTVELGLDGIARVFLAPEGIRQRFRHDDRDAHFVWPAGVVRVEVPARSLHLDDASAHSSTRTLAPGQRRGVLTRPAVTQLAAV